ncbi:MAG: glycosyltransferase family 4 protein [Actinomycetota bacterium]
MAKRPPGTSPLRHRQASDPADSRRPQPHRVVVNDYAGHAFPFELSEALADKHVEVAHLYCSTNVTPRGSFGAREDGPDVVGISTGGDFEKYHISKRLLAEMRYGVLSCVQLARRRPHVALNAQVPLVSLALITIAARVLRVRSVLWLQDLQSGLVALSVGERHVAARVARSLERWCIRRADRVVTISSDFEALVRSIDPNQSVETIPNWAPIAELPLRSKNTSWSRDHGLNDRFVFLYSGTLGIKHRPEALLQLSRSMADVDTEALVVVVSESVGATWLESQRTADDPLRNLVVLPFQPFERLADVLGSADVMVVLLDSDAGQLCVPSKVLSYLCAARAVLGLMPGSNAAARLITDEAKAGLVFEDLDGFVEGALQLLRNHSLRSTLGERGRAYAEASFDIDAISLRFLDVLFGDGG